MYICIYVYMYICIYVYMYIRICVYVYICICMYICIYVCMYTYIKRYTGLRIPIQAPAKRPIGIGFEVHALGFRV